MTVYERDRAGSPLGSSHGRSRIFRRSYREVDYLRLSLRAIEEWRRLDPCPLRQTGLLEYGQGVELHAAAMDEVGETYEWLEPAEAERRFPEARFPERALWDAEAGAIMADDALRALSSGLDVREGRARRRSARARGRRHRGVPRFVARADVRPAAPAADRAGHVLRRGARRPPERHRPRRSRSAPALRPDRARRRATRSARTPPGPTRGMPTAPTARSTMVSPTGSPST